MNLQWRPYMLRHAYAARLWRMGGSELDVFTAATLMGHPVKEHIETYRRHIDPVRGFARGQIDDFPAMLPAAAFVRVGFINKLSHGLLRNAQRLGCFFDR